MEVTLMLNGKQLKATVNDQEIKDAIGEKKEKRTGYEPCFNGFCVDGNGKIRDTHHVMIYASEISNEYQVANYYSDKNVTTNNARADALMRKLRRFAAEHGGCVSPKQVFGRPTFTINYIGNKHFKCVPYVQSYPTIPIFATIEATKLAIKEFHDELVWFFEEYDPMPNGWWDNDPEAY